MKILAIETSCDETAAAILEAPSTLLSSVVSSQMESHEKYGGVVPELAGRHHIEMMNNVVKNACEKAGVTLSEIDIFAGTRGPGLAAALLVGSTSAKTYAYALGKPFVGVHHHEAHILSVLQEHENVEFPFVSLLVAGGHTMIIVVDQPGSYRVLGGTIDDAAGEAYDKVARMLGLGYPGGPLIDKLADEGNPKAFNLPRPMKKDPFNTSFSGLKTAVKHLIRDNEGAKLEDICASFQAAVVDSLMEKTKHALDLLKKENHPAKSLTIGGGVAANSYLRHRTEELAKQYEIRALIPDKAMCTDNAAMIATAALVHFEKRGADDLSTGIKPNWPLAEL